MNLEEIKAKINTQYADTIGTESHERKWLCDLIESLRQQLASQGEALAAALATIKLKDEALKEIAGSNAPHIIVAMKALAIQPDDSALKAWIGEPVAWLHENRPEADVITDVVKNVWNGVVVGKDSAYSIPLYAQKRLTK